MKPASMLARAVALTVLAATANFAPAWAAVDTSDPGRFVDTLADTAFGALRSGNAGSNRSQFRAILARHLDVDAVGDRLIQRWRGKISPAQYQQYKAAFPGFIAATYGDRLAPYSTADLKVGRVVSNGSNAVVATTVIRTDARPASVIWTVSKASGGYKVVSITVSGVNLQLAQKADFDSTIQRHGFDALIAFMRSRG